MDVFELDGAELNRKLVKDMMTSTATVANKGETIADVISKMKNAGLRELPVLDGDTPIGCVTYNAFLNRRRLPFTSKVEQVMIHCPRIDEDMALTVAAEELVAAGIRGAPVVRGGKVVGYISRTDMVRILPQVDDLKSKKVATFMTSNPMTVKAKESVRRAQMIMKGLNEKVVPVVDDDARLLGVIGMTEVMEALWSPRANASTPGEIMGVHDREPPEPDVGGIMTRPALTVKSDDTLATVARTMVDKDISVLFVEEGGKLVGVVSQADLMEQIIGLRQREGVYVQITGLEEGDPDTYTEMYNMIGKYMQSINKIDKPLIFTIHVSMFHTDGLRAKYSMHGRLSTQKKLYFAKAFDWNIFKALNDLLDMFEKSVRKDHDHKLYEKKHASPMRAGSPSGMKPH